MSGAASRVLALAGAALCIGAMVFPIAPGARLIAKPLCFALAGAAEIILVVEACRARSLAAWPAVIAWACGASATLVALGSARVAGAASAGFWCLCLATWVSGILAVARLAAIPPSDDWLGRAGRLTAPAIFGATLLFLWEAFVRGWGVSPVLLPAPSAVATRFAASLPVLGEDFTQTILRGVLIGYAVGSILGLAVAMLVDGRLFLRRGVLPLSSFVSSLPIVGVAPIMVMWFGFDWPSKAAVVAIVTFFPMLTNAVAGLESAGRIERDLLRSYGASPFQRLVKLQLPAALPFIFNALKINSTLALIAAIVAEFFGTPMRGIGFRISIEAARMSLDMVWAEILLSALAGTAFYGVLTLIERAATFWHPSIRR